MHTRYMFSAVDVLRLYTAKWWWY